MNVHPVVGLLTPDPLGVELGTHLMRFSNKSLQVDGLCKVAGRRIDLVAICSRDCNKGNVSKFFDQLMAAYRAIYVWEIWSPVIKQMLFRRGFMAIREQQDVIVEGMMWLSRSYATNVYPQLSV
jgi:hypothetical protein